MGELEASIGLEEFERWKLFDRLEPLGRREQRQQLAQLGVMYATTHRAQVTTNDFLLTDPVERIRERQSNMIAGLRAVAIPSKKSRKRQARRRAREQTA